MAHPMEFAVAAVKQYRGLPDDALRLAIDAVVADLSRDPVRGQPLARRGVRTYSGTINHPAGTRSFVILYQYRIGDRSVFINSIAIT